jgi:hypothetical protein
MKNLVLLICILAITELQTFAQILRVQSGTCLKIGTSSTLDLGTANIVLDSDSLSTASLIDLGAVTYSGGGQIQVNRFITPSKWHFIASPVISAETGMFLDDYLQQFNESANQWQDILSTTAPLETMKGYSLWSTELSSTRELFTGTSHTGVLQESFSKGANGYNLLGNPYPSSIDWNLVNIPAGLNGQFYLWDPTIGSNGDYVYYIQGGGPANTTSQFIPSCQGFFVEANSPGVLILDNSARVHSTQNFYKYTESSPFIILKVTGNGVTTQTAIRFDAAATGDVDRLLDVRKILSRNEDIPNLYSYAKENKMAINTLSSVEGNEIINLGFQAGTNGNYTISLSVPSALSEYPDIILEDVLLNAKHDLKKQPEYSFSHSPGSERQFRLHLKGATGIENLRNDDHPEFTCTLANDQLSVHVTDAAAFKAKQDYQLAVYSISGQLAMQQSLSGEKNIFPFHSSKGVYLLRISSPTGIFSTKLVNP